MTLAGVKEYVRLVNMPFEEWNVLFYRKLYENECSEVLVRGEGLVFRVLFICLGGTERIVIKGKDRLYTDWRIESNVEEQKVMEHFEER